MTDDDHQIPLMYDGDPRFRSAFSRAIAEALLERERSERDQLASPRGGGRDGDDSSETGMADEAEECHRAMCFDDPVAPSDHALRSLASILTDRFGEGEDEGDVGTGGRGDDLGLSDRFVDGILQATSRHSNGAGGSSSSGGADARVEGGPTSQSPPSPSPSSPSPMNPATAAGYGELAFATFAAGPLGVLRDSDLRRGRDCCGDGPAGSFLGSYSGRGTRMADEEGGNKESADVELVPSVDDEDAHGIDDSPKDNDDDDDDSLREIFADESDPDDYEYESGYAYEPSSSDPIIDHTPSPPATSLDRQPLTRRDMLSRVSSLLSHLNYRSVASAIPSSRWGVMCGSRTLADLTMELLRLSEEEEEEVGGDCLGDEDGGAGMGVGTSFESEWPRVAFVLRDRALDPTTGHDALGETLSLVRQLLTRDEEGGAQKSTSPLLSPSRSVALMVLSSLCCSAELRSSPRSRSELLRFVLPSSSRPSTTNGTASPSARRQPSSMPMLDLLSEVTEAVRASAPPTPAPTPSSDDDDACGVAIGVWEERLGCVASVAEFVSGVGVECDGSLERDDWWGGAGGRREEVEGALLSSGYLRELVLLCMRCWAPQQDVTCDYEDGGGGGGKDGTAKLSPRPSLEAIRRRLTFALFVTCVRSEVACNFALRVPRFASDVLAPLLQIRSSSCPNEDDGRERIGQSATSPPVDSDAVLWSVLCSRHHGGRVRDAILPRVPLLKKKNDTQQGKGDNVDLVDSMDVKSVRGCTELCERASTSLSTLARLRSTSAKTRRRGSGTVSSEEDGKREAEGDCAGDEVRRRVVEETGLAAISASIALGDLVRFGRCLDSCPALARSWATSLAATGGGENDDVDDGRFLVESRRGLSDVRDALLFATTASPARAMAGPSDPGEKDASSNRGGGTDRTTGGGISVVGEEVLAAARWSVKVLNGIVLEADAETETEKRRREGDRLDGAAGAGTVGMAGSSTGGISSKTD